MPCEPGHALSLYVLTLSVTVGCCNKDTIHPVALSSGGGQSKTRTPVCPLAGSPCCFLVVVALLYAHRADSRGQRALASLFYKSQFYSSQPTCLPDAPSPNLSHWARGFQHMKPGAPATLCPSALSSPWQREAGVPGSFILPSFQGLTDGGRWVNTAASQPTQRGSGCALWAPGAFRRAEPRAPHAAVSAPAFLGSDPSPAPLASSSRSITCT